MPSAPPRIPRDFPWPVTDEPSATATMDLLQNYLEASLATLKRVGVSALATESAMDEATNRSARAALTRLSPDSQAQVLNATDDLRVYGMWKRHREAYEPHPVMSRALVKMSAEVTVPGSVFRRLPHINPIFLLDAGLPITLGDGKPGRMIAFMITGALSNKYPPVGARRLPEGAPGNGSVLLDTNDPEANAYRALVLSEIHSPDGTQVIGLDSCHLTVPIAQAFTLEDLVKATATDGFVWALPHNEDSTYDTRSQYLVTAARAVVSHLLYACSRTVELDDKPRNHRPPAKAKAGQPKPPRPARLRRMGWRMGAAIADSLRRIAEPRPDAPGTGHTKAPHMRSAHLHLYRVGPGRNEIDMKWLDPIPVNAQRDDGNTITSHPMH